MIELSATAAVDAMQRGDIKAEDYARALLDRARELSHLNAFCTLNPEMVLEAARTADKLRASGAKLGLLHGLPLPVKDSINTQDLCTSNGTRVLQHFKPKKDAALLKPLLAQGAILMGKTNLHELSFGWTSNNAVFGPVRNPYNSERIPGGSSGGSAAAVAARMAPLAIAADTLGSIRVPACMCGLAGFRPTFGRYPGEGIMALTRDKFDQAGSVARSVADLLLFDKAVTGDERPITAMSLPKVRIGISPDYFWSRLDPEVERIGIEALDKLAAAGVTLVQREIPETVKAAMEVARIILRYDLQSSISDFLKEQGTGVTFEQLVETVSDNIRAGMNATIFPPNLPTREQYEAALGQREALRQSIRNYFEESDIAALAFPPVLIPPPQIGEDEEVDLRGEKVPLSLVMGRNIKLGTCAGMASLVLAAGVTSNGLPVGLEFDALAGGDRQLLSLGVPLEQILGEIPAPNL